MATLTAYIIGTKHDIDNRLSALTITRGLLYRPNMSWTLVRKRLEAWPAFLPNLDKFCILFHCQTSQTEISKWNSAKLCQMADGKLCLQSAVEQLGSSPPQEKWGQETFTLVQFFDNFRHLMANVFWTKRDKTFGQGPGKYEGSPTMSKNSTNFGPQMALNGTRLFTHPHYFVPSQSIAHPLIGINMAPHSDTTWNGIGFVCSSDSKPHQMLSCNCYRIRWP